MDRSDIIAAIATPAGRGGIGVVRVSGGDLASLARKTVGFVPTPRHARFCAFLDQEGVIVDQGLVLFFPAPHSYTGEDVLELQGHGGPVIMKLLLETCLAAGARLARPGEFTLRAFLNGKLDLAQAESVADVIDASTSEAARCALRSLQGEFSLAIGTLVQSLIQLRMWIEAILDFPEEELDGAKHMDINDRLGALRGDLDRVLGSARQGSLLREGAWIVLVGRPNVGKSSLLNRLAGEDVAIVTEFPGTTRDVVRQTLEVEGIPLHLLDTAGLRETEDAVEKEGIARTRSAMAKANLVLLLVDSREGAAPEDREILDSLPPDLPVIHVYNKIDLLNEPARVENTDGGPCVYLSARSGEGIELLQKKMLEIMGWWSHAGEGVFMARQRHLEALGSAQDHFNSAGYLMETGAPSVLLAEELRLAQRALSSITGEFHADELLGEIFSRFCIGK